jgi:hypothetical protein
VYPLPGQIEFEGTAMAAALTLAEPGALRLPGLQKGSEKQRKEKQSVRPNHLLEVVVEILQRSSPDSFPPAGGKQDDNVWRLGGG